MSKKTYGLFLKEFKEIENERILKIYSPAYVFRWNKCGEWDEQFSNLLKK